MDKSLVFKKIGHSKNVNKLYTTLNYSVNNKIYQSNLVIKFSKH